MENIIPNIERTPELRFAHLAPEIWEALGKLERTGWVERGVKNPESVQEHTLALRNLAFSMKDFSSEERQELVDMLEIHDWPEAIHGDEVIIPNDREERARLKAIKMEKEKRAMGEICDNLGEEGKTIFDLWIRYETSGDKLAAFARDLDKYQAVEKALQYETEQGISLFQTFYDYAKNMRTITHPILLERMENLKRIHENK